MNDIQDAIASLISLNKCVHPNSIKLSDDSESTAGEIYWCGHCGAICINHIWHRPQDQLWQYAKFRAGMAAPLDLIKEKANIEAMIYPKRTGSPLTPPAKE